jgi:hypothetical protein
LCAGPRCRARLEGDHAKRFTARARVSGQIYGEGEGGSKKEAEQPAERAFLALEDRSPTPDDNITSPRDPSVADESRPPDPPDGDGTVTHGAEQASRPSRPPIAHTRRNENDCGHRRGWARDAGELQRDYCQERRLHLVLSCAGAGQIWADGDVLSLHGLAGSGLVDTPA